MKQQVISIFIFFFNYSIKIEKKIRKTIKILKVYSKKKKKKKKQQQQQLKQKQAT